MKSSTPSDDSGMITRLIGVLDLKDARAVHAIAGQRQRYQPRKRFVFFDGRREPVDGDPVRLLECYLHAGVGAIYLADLDGILHGCTGWDELRRIADRLPPTVPWFLDVGVNDQRLRSLTAQLQTLSCRVPSLHLVVATECCDRVDVINKVSDWMPLERIAVSFDYQTGRWLSSETSESEWVDACREAPIRTVIGLDLGTVGTGEMGRTEQLCRQLKGRMPVTRLITGGGVRTLDDAARLMGAGADRVLVASLFSDGE